MRLLLAAWPNGCAGSPPDRHASGRRTIPPVNASGIRTPWCISHAYFGNSTPAAWRRELGRQSRERGRWIVPFVFHRICDNCGDDCAIPSMILPIFRRFSIGCSRVPRTARSSRPWRKSSGTTPKRRPRRSPAAAWHARGPVRRIPSVSLTAAETGTAGVPPSATRRTARPDRRKRPVHRPLHRLGYEDRQVPGLGHRAQRRDHEDTGRPDRRASPHVLDQLCRRRLFERLVPEGQWASPCRRQTAAPEWRRFVTRRTARRRRATALSTPPRSPSRPRRRSSTAPGTTPATSRRRTPS